MTQERCPFLLNETSNTISSTIPMAIKELEKKNNLAGIKSNFCWFWSRLIMGCCTNAVLMLICFMENIIFEKVKNVLKSNFNVEKDILPDTKLSNLALDSLDFISFIFKVEEINEIKIPNEFLDNAESLTIEELMDYRLISEFFTSKSIQAKVF